MTVNVTVFRLSNMVNYWFMIRLVRVQVQIMSERENTKIIIQKIRRSQIIEWVMLVLLTVNTTSLITNYFPEGTLNPAIS